MSAPVAGSGSYPSVFQRTARWQAQGSSKGAPPPGNHRGPGALPAASASSLSIASFMHQGLSVQEAKGAKRRALSELATGNIGQAGKGPADSVLTLEIATGALATGELGVVAEEVGQHVFEREFSSPISPGEHESERVARARPLSPGQHDSERAERELRISPISPGEHESERVARARPISSGQRDSERAERAVHLSPGQHEHFLAHASGDAEA